VSAVDSKGRRIWIADAHRDDGNRFVVCAGEKLTAFLELNAAIWQFPCGYRGSSYGRGTGVGRGRGAGLHLPLHGP
jgi:hypothetical protein